MIKRLLSMIISVAIFITILPVIGVEAQSLDQDLLLWYKFNETSGNTIKDYSGNGKDATICGGTSWTNGNLYFDGSSGYAQMPNGILNGHDEVTISLFVKPEITAKNQFTWMFGNNRNVYMFLGTCNSSSKTKFEITTSSYGGAQKMSTTSQMSSGVWGNAVITISKSAQTAILYKDGIEAERLTGLTIFPSDLGATTANWFAKSPYGDPYFKGSMSDFRVYNRVLTSAEIVLLNQTVRSGLATKDLDAISFANPNSIISNITLPTTGVNGSTITWESSDPYVISNNGEVMRPQYGDKTVTLTATAVNSTFSATKQFEFTVLEQFDDQQKVDYDKEALVITEDLSKLIHNLSLPLTGASGSTITWGSSNTDVLTNAGIVKRPAVGQADGTAVLTATIRSGDVVLTRDFQITVLAQEEMYAYLFAYFTGNDPSQEKLYYALSKDGCSFNPLNNNNPVLSSNSGTKCLRDPFIMHGEDGYYYALATDMQSSLGWSSNRNLITWKSADLVNWTDETIIKICDGDYVSTKAGNRAWAPQAIYDPIKGEYMLYWATSLTTDNPSRNKIWYAYTKDFKTLTTEPAVLFTPVSGNDAIDADIYYKDGTYYMFYKDGTTGVKITTSANLSGPYGKECDLVSPVNVEGSCIYKLIGQEKWALIYDYYNYGYYGMSTTTDFKNFSVLPKSNVNINFGARHGTVIQITRSEYKALAAKWGDVIPDPPAEVQDPIAWYKFDGNALDSSGNGKNATLNGETSFVEGVNGQGQALKLNGSNAYVQLPQGILSNLQNFTISAWVRVDTSQNFQRVFDFGNNTTSYTFMTPSNGTNSKFSITNGGTASEYATLGKIPVTGNWAHMAMVLNENITTMYINGYPVASNECTFLKPYQLGATLYNYIGKSQWTTDPYFNGTIDDFRIYNRAVTQEELLVMAGIPSTAIINATAPQLKSSKLVQIDYDKKTIFLPVAAGTDLSQFKPEFTLRDGATIALKNGQTADFTNPAVYTVTGSDGITADWTVTAKKWGNTVLPGFYADPEIAVLNGKYYIYPTTDGFDSWSSYYFKAFSSPDLINWMDEGTILDLRNVPWTGGTNAWAPSITEYKGKYYYYYAGNKNIGVAVADSPTGPYTDSGKALITAGTATGQMIDPQVFIDDDGTPYLFWGNGRLYVIQLGEDMVSTVGSLKDITPPNFTEGIYVFKRNGTYYFTWSCNDTRSPDYQVRYGTSMSPFGPISGSTIILQKDESKEIYATGHHSIIKIPGKDEYYICYHRFSTPTITGDNYSQYYGTHREICIDKLQFNPDGTIASTVPTHEGITEPVHFGIYSRACVKIAGLKAGNQLNATVNVQNNNADENVTVIMALYDKNNKLVSTTNQSISVEKYSAKTIQLSLTLKEDINGHKVRIFTWDGLGSMKPVYESKVFK